MLRVLRRSAFLLSFGMLPAYSSLGAQAATPVVPATAARPASELVADGLAKAAAEHKQVLVKFSASWCGWCHKFERFLDDTTGAGQIMRANYVVVGLTILETPQYKALENAGGKDLVKSMGGNIDASGIPWFFMLDAAGKKIGDSNAMPNGGNLGMPDLPDEVSAFVALLKHTAPRMTEHDLAVIKVHLDSVAGRKPAIVP
jgi:thioredoxin-related protein